MSREELIQEFRQRELERYKQRTPKSGALALASQKTQPGGERVVYPYAPYPTYVERGEGCYLYDVDGNRYVDFGNCYTAAILGYAHPKVVEAMIEQTKKGTGFAHPDENRQILAEMICDRVNSVDKIRFVCSGTEACMFAVRTARGFTGKDKILTTSGAYHGMYDPFATSSGYRASAGIPKNEEQDVLSVPFNDKEAAEKAIRENKDDLAAMIVEPVQSSGGAIEARDDYLKFLREVTAKYNVLLIVDDVVTFRLARGGSQEFFDYSADLTTFGKNIGGLTPVGAIGGRKDIMDVLAPKEGRGTVLAGGTFGGNPLTMVAGIATLKELTPDVFRRINSLGDSLRAGLQAMFGELGVNGQVTGAGSISLFHFTTEEVIDHGILEKAQQDFAAGGLSLLARLMLMNRGILWTSGNLAITTPMSEKEIEACLSAFGNVLTKMKPLIEQVAPQLIG